MALYGWQRLITFGSNLNAKFVKQHSLVWSDWLQVQAGLAETYSAATIGSTMG